MNNDPLYNRRTNLRQEMIHRRNLVSETQYQISGEKVCEKICSLKAYQTAQMIMAYAPFGKELNIWPLIHENIRMGRPIALPRVTGSGTMVFHLVRDIHDLVRGTYGIMEPDGHTPIITGDFMIMPGLAFDKYKNRLGYGGGFYDRYLNQCVKKPYTCAVAYEFQIKDQVPALSHDQRPDCIITPDNFLS